MYTGYAWWVDVANGQHQLYQDTYKPPSLKSGQVLVHNHYAGINYKDALSVTGQAPISRLPKIIPGQDLSGVVAESASDFHRIGDKVLSMGHGLGEHLNGSLAEYTVVDATQAFKIPENWTLQMAASFGTAGFTAALALEKMRWNTAKTSDLPVLVTGASGGVGLHALLLLNKQQRLVDIMSRRVGTDIFKLFNIHTQHGPIETSKKPLHQPQWSAIIDSVGGDQLSELLKHITPWGQAVSIGITQSPLLSAQLYPFIVRGIDLLGMNASGCPLALKKKVLDDSFNSIQPDDYNIPIQLITFDDLPQAAKTLIEGTAPAGRFVVKFSDKI
ncbi:alcohol dehydrogenase catalytic domain-containing protein [Marinicella sp. W31]|uniref:alcohol dehydrogenase catalytic domain-containing protein n=1 Tax=Marinicella sp. W31 TaxID=3023713 RepID=UPI0037571DDC